MVKIHKLKMLQVQIWWQDCYYWQVPHIQQFNFWTNECEQTSHNSLCFVNLCANV